MTQKIALGTKVLVSTVGPRLIGPVVRDRQYAGMVLRQNPYETTHYPVKLDNGNVIIVNDSMLTIVVKD